MLLSTSDYYYFEFFGLSTYDAFIIENIIKLKEVGSQKQLDVEIAIYNKLFLS